MKMAVTQQKIDNMLQQADRLLGIYRFGAITLSIAHLGGFGYAIFGVEWLGWDMVQPLSFSVGTIYTLLGLRFYRKFQKDRNQESIQEALRGWVLKPAKRIELNRLQGQLLQEKDELKDVEKKLQLARNKLNPITTLPTNF